jgi:membrane protease YdiL (CAAX protease family)
MMHRNRVVIGFGIFAAIVNGLLFAALHYWPPH